MKCPVCFREGSYVRRDKKTKNDKEFYCRMCNTATPIINDVKKLEEPKKA